MSQPEDNGRQKGTTMVLDLSDFVTEVDRFSRLIEPFALVFYTIDDIRRWRFRNGTIIVWLLCNIACLWITQAAMFVLVSSFIIGVATLCLFQIHTRILDKLLPSSKKSVSLNEEESEGGVLDTVQSFRYSLIEMHDFVVKSNEYLNYFYSILKWDAVVPSAIYHCEASVFLISLIMCPARWNCFFFINWFFLCHPHILKRSYSYIRELWLSQSSKDSLNTEVGKKEHLAERDKEKEGDKCATDIDNDDDSSDMDMTDIVGDESMVSLDPSPSKPGMVARLMEIKKRRKQIANESCKDCKVSFASILKKRLYCRHCGYSFCNRCCYQMVPRSVFGATSPAAMKETVLVCCSCHSLLAAQGSLGTEVTNSVENVIQESTEL